jgi:two-component system nitrogen regulation response regulator GlnG
MAGTSPPPENQDTPTENLAEAVPRPCRMRVQVVTGPDLGRYLKLEAGTYFIGKGQACDLVLSDHAVSRRHLELAVLTDAIGVRDLGSTNGSYAGGARFESVRAVAGAILRIGQTELLLTQDEAAVSSPPAVAWPADELPDRFGPIVSANPTMRRILALLERTAPTDVAILVQGETGTGKEVVAEAVHAGSARKNGPFLVCDLGSLPRSLIESELFGHVRGAFTGAEREREGAFVAARGGTLFLDEIGELDLDAQPRLLRALERRQVKPVGASAYTATNVRVVAATNRDLLAEVRAGRFREDLYHRLAVMRVHLPPLRERREDIPQLVSFFLEQAALASGRRAPVIASDAMAALRAHDWPGNVRELRNVLERATTLTSEGGIVDLHLLGLEEPRGDVSTPPVDISSPFKEAKDALIHAWEREYVSALLAKHEGNVSSAARSGGLDRVYLHRLLKKHGVGGP